MRQLPMIALNHRLEEAECDLVTFDHEQAAYDATAQLIRQGCRRIGVTGMLDMLDMTHNRFRGYLRAMFDYGLQPEPQDFLFIATSGHDEPDPAALEVRLRSGDRPEAFVILQDSCAAAVVGAAVRAGLSVPTDLKVAALGSEYAVTVDDRGMTAIAFDWQTLADQAMSLLAERLRHLHRPAQVRVAPHRLVVRGLCGAPPEEWTPGSENGNTPGPAPSAPMAHVRFTSRWSVQDDRIS
jgi:LacI family transcriptional regulator